MQTFQNSFRWLPSTFDAPSYVSRPWFVVVFLITETRSLKTLANSEILILFNVAPVLVLPSLDMCRVVVRVFALILATGLVVLDHYTHAILVHMDRTGASADGSCVLLPSRWYGLRRLGSSASARGSGGGGINRCSDSSSFLLGLGLGSCLCIGLEGMLPRKLSCRGKPIEFRAPLAARPVKFCGDVRYARLCGLAFFALFLLTLLSAILAVIITVLLIFEEGRDPRERVTPSEFAD